MKAFPVEVTVTSTSVKDLSILVKTTLVTTSLAMTSLEEVSILEGIFSVVIFTVGNEHCNHIKDTGVESVKDAYRLELLTRA